MGRRGANGGSRPAEAAPIPFKSGKNLDGAKLFISFFLSAILLPHSNNNARGRGIEEKGERSQANWIRMLQDRKDLKRSCGIPDSRENFMLVCRAAGSALPPRLDPNES